MKSVLLKSTLRGCPTENIVLKIQPNFSSWQGQISFKIQLIIDILTHERLDQSAESFASNKINILQENPGMN